MPLQWMLFLWFGVRIAAMDEMIFLVGFIVFFGVLYIIYEQNK